MENSLIKKFFRKTKSIIFWNIKYRPQKFFYIIKLFSFKQRIKKSKEISSKLIFWKLHFIVRMKREIDSIAFHHKFIIKIWNAHYTLYIIKFPLHSTPYDFLLDRGHVTKQSNRQRQSTSSTLSRRPQKV